MPTLTYITPDEKKIVVTETKENLMKTAIAHGIPGIDGDCGGVCSCATCHVHVDPEWMEKVGPPHTAEQDMLELEDEATPCSRLGCQVAVTEELDGLVVRVVGR
jgi:2Fe-2S ferredoxin